jgi:hypothetical protein|eukprot:COSAG01_NODE_5980_length_3919_cov_9.290314_4_plen_213_part_00
MALGVAVGLREGFYLLLTWTCLFKNPAFLLLSVRATVSTRARTFDSGLNFVGLYILAPEKFVAWSIVGTMKPSAALPICFGSMFLLDLCGVGALSAGLASGYIPPALAVGYTVQHNTFIIRFRIMVPQILSKFWLFLTGKCSWRGFVHRGSQTWPGRSSSQPHIGAIRTYGSGSNFLPYGSTCHFSGDPPSYIFCIPSGYCKAQQKRRLPGQ